MKIDPFGTFLGFGFWPENTAILNMAEHKTARIYATALGLPRSTMLDFPDIQFADPRSAILDYVVHERVFTFGALPKDD